MDSFTINETINSRHDLGLRITEPPIIPSAQRIVNSIEVDGREGALTILKGWEDTVLEMRVALIGQNLQTRWREVLPKLLSAQTIYLSNDKAVSYTVKHVQVGPLERKLSILSEFSLSFTCAPFRYMRGVNTVTMITSGNITNPGTVYSLPCIKVYGTGSRTLTINGKQIGLNILSGNLTLDSELKECFYGNVAQNNRMTGDFPVFEVGNNAIVLGSGITKIEIEPRWRFI